ncbi:MAG: hypothetical protein RB292_04885 [Patescibacteria group bacterium]|jgi:hypothetical protein|nr:hypothetical protein [Patescibacteria group bacterium]
MTDSSVVKQYFIIGRVDRFIQKDALIILANGEEVSWPINNLPPEIEAGSEIKLILSTAETEEFQRQQLAKSILNEVLNIDKNDKSKSE